MRFFFLFLLFFSYISAQHDYVLTHRFDQAGFFSSFHTVLGALDFLETSTECSGLSIDFEDKGLYYDPGYGSNWWTYYFEPINMSCNKPRNIRKFTHYQKIIFSVNSEFGMPRERGYELIRKYVFLRPHILSKIDFFIKKNFQNLFVIGIHYRGTDKCLEANIVPYRDVTQKINSYIRENQLEKYKIFIATDDTHFLAYMRAHFPAYTISIDAIRSEEGSAVHFTEKNFNYQKGEDALVDCVLLSKCDILFKMSSNLSNCSLKFNPYIPVVELNKSNGV